jgi:high affinity sulfate transporter 1
MTQEIKQSKGFAQYLPILSWLPNYQRSWLRSDLIAGVVVLTLLVPEGMAYAQMAGLPPETAFYTAPAAMIGYALFSTSRQVITTTTSTIAVMIAAVVGALAVGGSAEYLVLASGLAIMVGLMFLLMGFLRLGFVSEFFSKPVITGFIFGLAMIIAIRQVPKLFGFEVEGGNFFERLFEIVRHVPETNGWTLFVGLTSLILLFGLEHFFHRIPGALIAVVYGILIVTILGLENLGVHIVGEIPSGIAPPRLPDLSLGDYSTLIIGAVGIVVLGYAETIGAARKFATKHRYDLNTDQELYGLGVANIGAGLFQGFAVDASLSKSAANDSSGAQTQMSAIIAAGLTIITALFLTPLFKNLPEATLAAIVIHAVWGLFDVKEIQRYAQLNRDDFVLSLIALLGVLILDVIPGLVLAVILSIIILAYRASRPQFAILGKIPGKDGYDSYVDVKRHPEGQTIPGLVVVRPDAPMFFANATLLREEVRHMVRESEPEPQVVILDMERTPQLDVTSIDALAELKNDLETMGVELWLARTMGELLDNTLQRSGLEKLIGSDHIFATVHEAGVVFLDQQSG